MYTYIAVRIDARETGENKTHIEEILVSRLLELLGAFMLEMEILESTCCHEIHNKCKIKNVELTLET